MYSDKSVQLYIDSDVGIEIRIRNYYNGVTIKNLISIIPIKYNRSRVIKYVSLIYGIEID